MFLAPVIATVAIRVRRAGRVEPPKTLRQAPLPGTQAHRHLRQEITMAVIRMHHYAIDAEDLDEMLARRAVLISAVRAAYSGLAETRLTRLQDGTYTDTWRWDTADQMKAARPAAELPEARAAMALVRDATAVNGEIIDER